MKFNWNGFTEEDFVDYCARMENDQVYDGDFIGCVTVGDLCFDLIVRENGNELMLDYDLYVGGIDDGYGYGKDNYPYTEGGGGSFGESMISYTYDAFVKWAEFKFKDFIMYSYMSSKYNLVEKANEPLHVW